MSDVIITAEYLEQVAENIEDALIGTGLPQRNRTVEVSVNKSDANTMREAAALMRDMETQIKALTETITAAADALTYAGATLHAQHCKDVLELVQNGVVRNA